MTFKETMKSDVKKVFMNFSEFGEMHKLNGMDTLVIVDEYELTEREKRIREGRLLDEKQLFKKQLLFYVAAEDFGLLPSPGKLLNFDGKQYTITDANNEDGIYSISLEANRS